MKEIRSGTITFIAIVVVVFVVGVIGLTYRKIFEPENKKIDREVFEQTPSYINGKVEELYAFKRQIISTEDEAVKTALTNEAIYTASQIDDEHLPDDLLTWVKSIR